MNTNWLIIISVFSVSIFSGCNTETKKSNENIITDSNVSENLFSLKSELNSFRYSKFNSIDFSSQGELIQEIENLQKVDSEFKNTNFHHFLDTSWKNVTEIFKYGTIVINENEQPVYLSIKDHDGYSYNYHLAELDNKGQIKKAWIIAYSWTAAECIGYDRVFIKSDSMISETLQKCFDEELKGQQSVDSIRDVAPLSTFHSN
ncbi:MAG: hypothetical protein DWP98_00845 [Bacteroidetes bacterium]|nr:MAG: hypothetical protein DWP98_00845 [Bacteroidota bacterium]MBL1143838.1 hypothetical protein [Bacteroidota bacterium]NOG56639.1 hypothetical protein [Bacteroidota bacterium]